MSKHESLKSSELTESSNLGRRTWLSQVAWGGLALAALTSDTAEAAEPPAGADQCAVMQPIMSNKIRRVVTTVNAEGSRRS